MHSIVLSPLRRRTICICWAIFVDGKKRRRRMCVLGNDLYITKQFSGCIYLKRRKSLVYFGDYRTHTFSHSAHLLHNEADELSPRIEQQHIFFSCYCTWNALFFRHFPNIYKALFPRYMLSSGIEFRPSSLSTFSRYTPCGRDIQKGAKREQKGGIRRARHSSMNGPTEIHKILHLGG